jgi:hypothetical protein
MADKHQKSWLDYIGIGTLLAGGLYLASQWLFKRFYIQPGRPQITTATVNGSIVIQIKLPLSIHNSTGIAVPVTSFVGNLSYGPTQLGYIQWFPPPGTLIPARGELLIEPVLNLPIASTAGNLVTMIVQGNIFGVLNVKGYLYMPDLTIPINQNIALA